jgi:hypothetical protein
MHGAQQIGSFGGRLSHGTGQAAKITLFAAGKLCRVSKKSPQAIFSN